MIKLTVIIPVYNQEQLVLRALHSIPCRDDIEVIVVDDCSTDGTFEELITYQHYSNQNIIILANGENRGVGYSVNKGLDAAQGEYVVLLGSDDYFMGDLLEVVDKLSCDLTYFDLEINDGTIFKLQEDTKELYCGSTKFIKRSFLGDSRCPEVRFAEDQALYKQLLEKNPTEEFTNKVLKHYNYPREGSLCYLKTEEDKKCMMQ